MCPVFGCPRLLPAAGVPCGCWQSPARAWHFCWTHPQPVPVPGGAPPLPPGHPRSFLLSSNRPQPTPGARPLTAAPAPTTLLYWCTAVLLCFNEDASVMYCNVLLYPRRAEGVECVVAALRTHRDQPMVQLSALLCIVPLALENPYLQVVKIALGCWGACLGVLFMCVQQCLGDMLSGRCLLGWGDEERPQAGRTLRMLGSTRAAALSPAVLCAPGITYLLSQVKNSEPWFEPRAGQGVRPGVISF